MFGWFGGGDKDKDKEKEKEEQVSSRSTKRHARFETEDSVELQEKSKSSKGGGWFGWFTGGNKVESQPSEASGSGGPGEPTPKNSQKRRKSNKNNENNFDAVRSLREWATGAKPEEEDDDEKASPSAGSTGPGLGLGNLLEGAGNVANGGLEANAICPSLTVKQRVIGFMACMAGGGVISLLSGFSLLQAATGGAAQVAIMFSLANVLSLVGTGFLVSPKTQMEKMTAPERRKWSALYIGAIIATFVVAFIPGFPGSIFVLLGLVVVQYAALLWYTLSYIPFGQQLFQGIIANLCKKEESSPST